MVTVKYVVKRQSTKTIFKYLEYWKFPGQSLVRQTPDDTDGGQNLIIKYS